MIVMTIDKAKQVWFVYDFFCVLYLSVPLENWHAGLKIGITWNCAFAGQLLKATVCNG